MYQMATSKGKCPNGNCPKEKNPKGSCHESQVSEGQVSKQQLSEGQVSVRRASVLNRKCLQRASVPLFDQKCIFWQCVCVILFLLNLLNKHCSSSAQINYFPHCQFRREKDDKDIAQQRTLHINKAEYLLLLFGNPFCLEPSLQQQQSQKLRNEPQQTTNRPLLILF